MQTVQNCQGFHTLWFFDSSEPWASQLLGSTFGWKLWSKKCLWRTLGATEVDFGGDGGKPDLWMLNPLTTWHPMKLCCIFHLGSQLDIDSFQHNRLCWICFSLKTTNDSVASLHHHHRRVAEVTRQLVDVKPNGSGYLNAVDLGFSGSNFVSR